jgi:hypothetical protein
LYYSFIFPFWANTYTTNLQCLVVLQKKAVRIICFVPNHSHTADLFKQLSILKFQDIHAYLRAVFMMKMVTGHALNVYKGMFNYNFEIHSKNPRSLFDFHLLKVSSDLGKMLIKYHSCIIWNKLSKLITSHMSLQRFKKFIKMYLINNPSFVT